MNLAKGRPSWPNDSRPLPPAAAAKAEKALHAKEKQAAALAEEIRAHNRTSAPLIRCPVCREIVEKVGAEGEPCRWCGASA